MDVAGVVARVLADRPFLERSGGGVTLTGGEPTAQPAFAIAILDELRQAGIHTAMETCGQFPAALVAELLPRVDLFLFDIKHLDPQAHRQGTGVDNRQILANFAAILAAAGPSRLIPRMPLIPGFNMATDNLQATFRFLADLGYAGEVHLMPHHGWAKAKYASLGREGDFQDAGEVSAETLAAITRLAESAGLQAVCYG
jgi:pyruvate formate lyase activating enzyme